MKNTNMCNAQEKNETYSPCGLSENGNLGVKSAIFEKARKIQNSKEQNANVNAMLLYTINAMH